MTKFTSHCPGEGRRSLVKSKFMLCVMKLRRNQPSPWSTQATSLSNIFGVALSASMAHKYLAGHLKTLKKAHAMPAKMNSNINMELHRQFVIAVGEYMCHGKQVICMDVAIVNLFCQHSQGRAPKGKRAVAVPPASKGKDILINGAICAVHFYLNFCLVSGPWLLKGYIIVMGVFLGCRGSLLLQEPLIIAGATLLFCAFLLVLKCMICFFFSFVLLTADPVSTTSESRGGHDSAHNK